MGRCLEGVVVGAICAAAATFVLISYMVGVEREHTQPTPHLWSLTAVYTYEYREGVYQYDSLNACLRAASFIDTQNKDAIDDGYVRTIKCLPY